MTLGINREAVEYVWDSCLDVASFTGIGYFSGRAVNWFIKWTSTPSLFKKPDLIDLTSAAICCALFAVIDRVAHFILSSLVGSSEVNKPVYSVLRIGVSITAAVSLFNALSTRVKLTSVEMQPAVAVILTAIVIYSQILSQLLSFNARYTANEFYLD